MVAVIIVVNKSLVICEDLTSLLEEKTEYSLHLWQDFMCNSSNISRTSTVLEYTAYTKLLLEISHTMK